MDDRIKIAKIKIMLENPFFATGLMSLNISESKEVPTVAVDPYGNVRVNTDFIRDKTIDEVKYLLCHELLHVVFLHLIRRGSRNPILWNIAIDMAVDDFLEQSGMQVFHNLNDLYSPPRRGMSAEEIYEWLLKQFPDTKNLQGKNYDVHNEIQAGEERTKGKDCKCVGGEKNKDKGGDRREGIDNKCSDKEKYKNEEEEDDIKEIEKKWRNVLIQMFHQVRMRGSSPGWLEEAVQGIIEPKISWRQVLQQFIQQRRKVGSSWLPPNKKYLAYGIYLPSYYEEFLKLAVVIDTSGSISTDELKLFLSEVEGVLSGVRDYEILLLQCDTRVIDEQVIHTGESLPDNYTFKGRGGTDFRPAFERLEEENDLDGIIFFTDGMGDYPEKEPYVPVLWALVQDYDVPFGEKIIIEEELCSHTNFN